MVLILALTLCLNFYLYVIVPKGFFPQQDTGRINGSIQADQSISFPLMRQKLQQFIAIVQKDPAVDSVAGFTGGGQTNGCGTRCPRDTWRGRRGDFAGRGP